MAAVALLTAASASSAAESVSHGVVSSSETSVPEKPANGSASGEKADLLDESLLDLDITQLGNVDVVVPAFDVEVTSVTKTESTVGKSPAAIFVITPEMIRRSAATSIPELLRLVPGMHVARMTANSWAISSRGFNDHFTNKLLVLIDGRSVYTPLFSGVYWDIQDLLLEDIERIEVIRGPGAAIWGANAVNGVINIITKTADDTQGVLVTGIGGSEDKAITGLRYGGVLGSNTFYRVYGKYFERDASFLPEGAHDDWRQGRLGARIDWLPTDDDRVTIQGDYYHGTSGFDTIVPSPPPAPFIEEFDEDQRPEGGNVLARWTHEIDESSSTWLQLYYDRADRRQITLDQAIETLDAEFGHVFSLADDQRLTWGVHYRHVSDDLKFPNPFVLTFDPASRRTNLISAFFQDEITLVDDRLFLTLGSKFEHNDFTGFEFQPTARLLWAIDETQAVWGAISRAVRVPSRVDDDARMTLHSMPPVTPPFPNLMADVGDRAVESEELIAYELGYRAQPTDDFSWDASAFINSYEQLMHFEVGAVIPAPPATIEPRVIENSQVATTAGVELAAAYQVFPYWRVHGSYSYIHRHGGRHIHAHAADFHAEKNSPNIVYLQSSWDLPQNFEFDMIGYYVDNVQTTNVSNYTALDLRIGWRRADWEFAVVGKSLLDPHRREFAMGHHEAGEVERSVYVQATWRH